VGSGAEAVNGKALHFGLGSAVFQPFPAFSSGGSGKRIERAQVFEVWGIL
jgi:hypothetical protein